MSVVVESEKNGRRLILAKEALLEAQRLVVASPFDLNLMRAVWQADFALELALPALYEHKSYTHPVDEKDPRQKPGIRLYFNDLEKIVFKTNAEMKHLIRQARHVHEARNDIQHGGTCFSQADSIRYVNDARNLLDALLQEWIGVDLYGINLSLINTDTEAQIFFDEAIEHIKSGEYNDASSCIGKGYRIGYENLLFLNNDLVQRDPIAVKSRQNQFLHLRVEKVLKGQKNNLNEAIEIISEPLGLTQFGVELNTAVQFLNLLPKLRRAVASPIWILHGEIRSFKKEEAEYLFDQALLILYRIRSILMI